MELESLFEEVDQDKSGTVDIDEMIVFISSSSGSMSSMAQCAVLNVNYIKFKYLLIKN